MTNTGTEHSVNVEVKELDGLFRQLAIQVPPDTFQSEMDRKFEEVRRKVTMKGFRKGKAPLKLVKSNYEDSVRADVVDKLIKSTYPEAVTSKTLRVASPPEVTDLKFEDDGGFSYIAKVEVFPEIEKVRFDGLELKTTDTDASDKEVDEFVDMLRDRHAEIREVNRAIEPNDIVTLDLKKVSDPELVLKETNFPETTVDLSNPMTIKEFKEQLPAMKVGDEKDITVRYDKGYTDKNLAGSEITYHAKVTVVKEKILPEVDNAFAKAVAKAETVLELRLKAREEIKRHKDDEQNKNFKSQMIKQIVTKNPVPVPESTVEHYLDSVVADLKRQDARFDESEVRQTYRAMAEETIRWQILFHRLADQEKIEVFPSDTEKVISRMAEAYQITPEKAKQAFLKSGRADDIRDSLLEEKVLDLLTGRAKKKPEKK